MKTKKILIIMTITMLLTILFCIQSTAKANAKTITIDKGKTYNLKVKKGSKVSVSNTKVAKINKKGKITALNKGKCIIKVKKRKKIKKYNIVVENKKWGVLSYDGLIVERIEPKDNTTSTVYLKINENSVLKIITAGQSKYVKCEISQEKISYEKLQSGDKVILYCDSKNFEQETVNDLYIIKSAVEVKKG